MSLNKLLQPDLILGSSVLSLTPDILEHHHLEALVLDVDETLVPINESQASAELREWVLAVKPSVDLWLVSNNISQTRIRRIAESLDVPYISGALKPSRRKLRQAVTAIDSPVGRIAMVGDRLLTDVLAGNRLGMFTILVDPILNPAEVMQKNPVRNFEVWLSQLFGVSLAPLQRSVIDSNNS